MNKAIRVITAIVCTFGAGAIGSLFVGGEVNTWYATLTKPPLMPPDWVFPVAWTILYALMVAAALVTWLQHAEHSAGWMRFYFVHLLPNAAWTILFFGYHDVLLAFIDILILLGFVAGLILFAWEAERKLVAYLLLPYLLWLLFATYLNIGIWMLN